MNVRGYKPINKNTEKMTVPMIQVKTSVFLSKAYDLTEIKWLYQNTMAHYLT